MKQTKLIRMLAFILVIVMMLEMGPVQVFATGSETTPETAGTTMSEETASAETSEIPEVYIEGEVTELRSEYEKHYRLTDGSFMAVQYQVPVHYEDDGQWVDIDNTLEAVTMFGGDSVYQAVNGENVQAFASDLSDGTIMTMATDDHMISMSIWTYDSVEEAVIEDEPENSDIGEDYTVETEPEATQESVPEETADSEEATEASNPDNDLAGDVALVEEEWADMSVLSLDDAENVQEDATVDEQQDDTIVAQILTEEVAEDPVADAEETEHWELDDVMPDTLSSSILYEDVFPGVDLRYDTFSYNVKESIILKQPMDLDEYTYSFLLTLDGLEPELQEDGSILLFDDADEVQYTIPAPYMWDAENVYSDAVIYELEETNDGWILTVCADENWLEAEDRAYPVTIDPSYTRGSGSMDFAVSAEKKTPSDSSDSSVPGYFSCGYSKTYGHIEGYIRFNSLKNIPVGSTIIEAKFDPDSLYQITHADCRLDVYMMTEGLNSSEWDNYVAWNARPATEDDAMDFIFMPENGSPGLDPKAWDITPAVMQWYKDPDTNYGINIKPVTDAAAENVQAFIRFKNNNATLSVTYRNSVGIESYYTYETQSASRAGTGYVGDFTSELTVFKSDLSYSSTTIPFSLSHVFNSVFAGKEIYAFDFDDTYAADYSHMKFGNGWQLSVQESVFYRAYETDGDLVYRDSDGTLHHFKWDPNTSATYIDEDGLGLKIVRYAEGPEHTYRLKDQAGNTKSFYHNMLYCIKDGNGNGIYFLYNGNPYSSSSTNWRPTGTDDKLTQIVAVNKGQEAQEICTLTYDSDYQLSQIIDFAGRKTQFNYDENGNLTKVTHPDGTAAHYAYDSNGQLIRMYDDEADYGIQYEYNADGVSAIHEYTAASINGTQTVGVQIQREKNGLQEVHYRYDGDDREFNSLECPSTDDIVNCYYFDYTGRTINAVTLNYDETTILGVTSAAYKDTDDASNNKIEKTAQSGQNGVNMLSAGGVETHNGYTPSSSDWVKISTDGNFNAVIKTDDVARTGIGSLKTWMGYGATGNATRENENDTKRIAIYQTKWLDEGTYTVSAYVNTQGIQQFDPYGGAYVAIMNSNNEVLSVGNKVSHVTSDQIDDGWLRVYATFECDVAGNYRIAAVQDNAYGHSYFDDLQLEEGNVPSNVNLLQNGSFTENTSEWTTGSFSRSAGEDPHEGVLSITGDPEEKLRASQQIIIGKICTDQTFLLSGWGKAVSGAGCVQSFSSNAWNTMTAEQEERYFGLVAKCHYTYNGNNDTYYVDHFYMPFNDDYDGWQFASCVIVPSEYYQKMGMVLEHITVYAVYDNNFNTMYVDNLSLRQEPCTTYTYNAAGNISAVNATGSANQAVRYVGETDDTPSSDPRPATVWKSESEAYYYSYGASNKYLPTQIANASTGVYTRYTYDSFGNVTMTENAQCRISDSQRISDYYISSTAEYSDDGSQLVSETNGNGQTTSYQYNGSRDLVQTTDSNGTKVVSMENSLNDRPSISYISGVVSVNYDYSNGLLNRINRGGYITGNATKQNQYYNMSYDSFGNMTEVSIGEDAEDARVLASYSYGSENNHLDSMTYGNGDSIEYTYDNLDRMTQETWDDGTSYLYMYNAEGALAQKIDATDETKVDNGTADAVNYQYDSLGRLIYSSSAENGETIILTEHLYDRQNRIDKQTYQLRNSDGTFTTYVSDYSYRADDGVLTYVDSVNGNFGDYEFEYDDIARLSARNNHYFRQDYTYRNISSDQTTTQISNIAYSKRDGGANFSPFSLAYTYDALGNIKTITGTGISGQNASYVYDVQSQLTSAVVDGKNYSYEYDTYGNIRKAVENGTTHTYTYGDADWKDLLTAYDGQTITYDEIGNPTSYYNGTRWAFDWEKGRQLVRAESDDHVIEYTYDMAGIRDSKTVDGVEYNYLTLDGKVVRQTWGSNVLDIIYDNSGLPYALKYNGAYYIYVLNQQGDVIRIVNSTGATVAEYRYDAWGNVIYSNGSMAAINPIRYRGYYYDTETGFYYLQSRYYDPSIGRFINADSVTSTGQSFIGHNMFAYCGNNPVIRIDTSGDSFAIVIAMNYNLFGYGFIVSLNFVSTNEDFGIQYSYYSSEDPEITSKNNNTIGVDIGPYVGIQSTDKESMNDLKGYGKSTGGDLFYGLDLLTDESGKYYGWQMGVSGYSKNVHSFYTYTDTLVRIPKPKLIEKLLGWLLQE